MLLAIATSCKEPTQVVVEAHTNVEFKAGIVTSFTVGGPGQTEKAEPTTETAEPWNGSLIGTLVVVPGTADDATLAVKLVMGVTRGARDCVAPDYRGCIVARRRLRYVPNERLRLPITLYAACQDVPCDELSTCSVLGKCVPVEPECKDSTCALPGELAEDGGVVVQPADGSADALAGDAALDAGADAKADAGDGAVDADAGPSTPGIIDCRTMSCSTSGGQHCCYDVNSNGVTGCAAPNAGCNLGGGAYIDISCYDDSDCTNGEVCCYYGVAETFQCMAASACAAMGKKICHVNPATCASCNAKIDGSYSFCQ